PTSTTTAHATPVHFCFLSHRSAHPLYLHSFPTRRSSDLILYVDNLTATHSFSDDDLKFLIAFGSLAAVAIENSQRSEQMRVLDRDRKSTRLNSSHVSISYAVFCLKKKNRRSRVSSCC